MPDNTTAWLDWEGIARDPLARGGLWAIAFNASVYHGPLHVQRDLLPRIVAAASDPESPLHRYYRFRSDWPGIDKVA
jgi:hypothetical protein